MTTKKILTVGLELASEDTQFVEFSSRTSLLDWDIILFTPEIRDFIAALSQFSGKPSLSDGDSFRLKECCEHWRREIKSAIETGKTVIVYLPSLVEVYVDTGQREHSGTGRNQKTTRIVAPFNNYEAIPASLKPINTDGKSMKLATRGAEVLAPYWKDFGSDSQYKVTLNGENIPACLLTKAGDKAVGAIYRSKSSSGTLLLLPHIDFYPDRFLKHEKDGSQSWKKEAVQFSARLVSSLVSLDSALRSSGEVTPEPDWSKAQEFSLKTESDLRLQLLSAEKDVERAQKRKESISESLKNAGTLRSLLFEKGKPLERAIIEALRILGFNASPYKDESSEFDVVFESPEGRLIGEAEGKDTKAINIDKLRQLSMNIHEDLQRDCVSSPAKPVLFGNGYRLQKVGERENPFTEKCIQSAATSSTALVATTDLFRVVQHLTSEADPLYAKACRSILLSSIGRVAFPEIPSSGVRNLDEKEEPKVK